MLPNIRSSDCREPARHITSKSREALKVTNIRKRWAEKVGEASKLVVELHVEASVPRGADPACRVRGSVGVLSPPRSDDERYHLAQVLVGKTVLPLLRPNMEVRILDMTTKRIGTRQHTIKVKDISMPRFMWWEKEYVENPYMRALPMKELNQRFFDTMLNSNEISKDGKLGIQVATNGVQWMRYVQHVLTEAKMRELPMPLFLDDRYSPDWAKDAFMSSVKGKHSTSASDAVAAWAKEKDNELYVVKYGEYRFMKEFLESGQMLIQPSRNFDDESYNQALRDDENSASVFGVRTTDGTVIPAHDIRGWGDRYSMREFSSSMDRDYMMYCMARRLSPTLFSHFGEGYDSCVLIHNMDEFVKRMGECTKKEFPPEDFAHGRDRVTYIDPLGAIQPTPDIPEESKVAIPFLKHFRHTYQDEFRFVWVPRTPMKDGLTKAIVSIGPLEDIAEIIRI